MAGFKFAGPLDSLPGSLQLNVKRPDWPVQMEAFNGFLSCIHYANKERDIIVNLRHISNGASAQTIKHVQMRTILRLANSACYGNVGQLKPSFYLYR